jgi:hypothetical protein
MERCLAAVSYWAKNMEQFDTCTVAVIGEEESLVRGSLIWAFWIGWCREDCDWKTFNPPVDAIIEIAEGYNE